MNPFWAIGSCLLLAACTPVSKRDSEPPEMAGNNAPITIDFQTGFQDAPVRLLLNGRSVFEGTLTTDDTIGLAHSMELSEPLRSPVMAELIVAGRSTNRFAIDLAKGRYVGFSEDIDTGVILMETSREPFLYD